MTRKRDANRSDWILLALDAAEGHRLTPVQLQKSLFLLAARRAGEVGTDFYNFRPYHYGPFDADVYHDADELQANGQIVVDASHGRALRNYVLTEDGEHAARLAAKRCSAKGREYLKHVIAWAQTLPFSALVRAVYDAYPDMKANSIFQEPADA